MTRALPERVLEYSVPLFVVVRDDGEGKYHVAKVVVYDEATLSDPKVFNGDGQPVPAHIVRRSKRLAEIMAEVTSGTEEFPSWEFGW